MKPSLPVKQPVMASGVTNQSLLPKKKKKKPMGAAGAMMKMGLVPKG